MAISSALERIDASGLRKPCATADAMSPTAARDSLVTMVRCWAAICRSACITIQTSTR
ncbi:hypothetical protein D3C72_2546350 [compost metagenome]